jgi:serine/threonine protein kinase
MSLAAGSRIGVYDIVAPIGAGGMGEVYRAHDSRLRRDIALKILAPQFASDPDRVARFEREAHVVASLSHPNILAIHDFGRDSGMTYAAMELLEGQSLRQAMANGRLPQRKALDYARQIARALDAAHARGIVHRDLKPENVFITTGASQSARLRARVQPCGVARGGAADDHRSRHARGHDDGHAWLHVA